MLGIRNAEHEETSPGAASPVISKLARSLANKTQTIRILPGSLVHQAYGCTEVREQFSCNYGLNPRYRDRIDTGKLKATGFDLDGEVRIVELSDHSFYVATLFIPQVSSKPESPHPLIVSYLKAGLSFRNSAR